MKARVVSGLLPALSLSLAVACNKPQTEIVCGGALGAVCPVEMYCDLGPDCGGFDREGVCRQRPLQCDGKREPVCSCDGRTYTSACLAAARGISVAHQGGCAGESENQAAEAQQDDRKIEEEPEERE